jgi:hypothetical protein
MSKKQKGTHFSCLMFGKICPWLASMELHVLDILITLKLGNDCALCLSGLYALIKYSVETESMVLVLLTDMLFLFMLI